MKYFKVKWSETDEDGVWTTSMVMPAASREDAENKIRRCAEDCWDVVILECEEQDGGTEDGIGVRPTP